MTPKAKGGIAVKKEIFREGSLERLSSPEQLDQLIKVTSPRAWLALAAVAVILLSIIVWSFLGSLPAKVAGQGILLNNGGVSSLEHHTAGRVIDIRFKAGDMVKKGDIVALIDRPELTANINSLLAKLGQMEAKHQAYSAEYRVTESQIEELRREMIYQSQIVSPLDGRILDWNIQKGGTVRPGETLAVIEQYGASVRLEAVIYVSAEMAEEIQPGMEAQITPAQVNKEEYGYMLGRVTSVAEYPSTAKAMLQILGNEALVSLLAGHGAPLKVEIELTPDNGTVSGYKWSSPQGPPISIPSGTLVQSEIVIKREKPIAKVIPLFRE
jgi:multidrug efflux pump subunit AcrA (membrane-fusion protein)